MPNRFAPIVSLLLASTAFVHADRQELVDSFVKPLVDQKIIAGCVVGIIEGEKAEVYGYGTTDLTGGTKPNGDTIFEIGSMTKAFTGTLLADMVNKGQIHLDAPLKSFLPKDVNLKEVEGHAIKLIDVAAQRSGLPRMPTNFAPKDESNPYADYTEKDLYVFLNDYQLTRPPGTYEYSNLGVGLLGQILAHKAGKSYETLLTDRICTPMEMKDTTIALRDDQKARLARPYNAALAPERNWDFDALVGAGGIRSSVNDLLKFARAGLSKDDRPVVKAIHTAWQPVPVDAATQPTGPKMGLCWMIAGDGQTRWHNGMTGGYSSVLFIHSGGKKAVVVLCNTATDRTTALGEKLVQALFGMKVSPATMPKEVQVPAEVLKRYVGEYQLAPGAVFTVTLEEGKLMAQLTGQPKIQVFATSEKEFFYKVVDAQLSFEVNEKGETTKLTLHQNGMNLPAPKTK